MKVWKFKLDAPDYVTLTSKPTISYRGKFQAVVLAETEMDARAEVHRYATRDGDDVAWLEIAKVTALSLDAAPCVLSFIMVD